MAKGNMFQGMARGKVGDVVFSRLNGEQISRVRNRNPKNPRTNPQLYQRAIMATIMRAYSAGKVIFDHSFQFLSVGAANQRKFMSDNAKLLRSLIATEYNLPVTTEHPHLDARARVVAPGVASPVGFDGMVVAKGTYQQNFFDVKPATSDEATGNETYLLFGTPAITEGQTRAQYAAAHGLIANDYYTFVGFFLGNQSLFNLANVGDLLGSSQVAEAFFFIRCRVKADFVNSTEVMTAAATLADIFEVDATTGVGVTPAALLQSTIGTDINCSVLGNYPGETGASNRLYAGIIRSRLDQDLRSDTTLSRGMVYIDSGITPYWILDAWKVGAQTLGDSELILEGGNF